jgi:DNA-binding XRE family transcriptional regulator
MEDTMKKEQLQIVANILENEEFKKRKSLGLTQKEMAKYLNVSRNTIQRAEKYAHQRGL